METYLSLIKLQILAQQNWLVDLSIGEYPFHSTLLKTDDNKCLTGYKELNSALIYRCASGLDLTYIYCTLTSYGFIAGIDEYKIKKKL